MLAFVRRFIDPELELDAADRAALAAERTAYNVRIIRWMAPIAALIQAVVAVVLARAAPYHGSVEYRRDALIITTTMTAFAAGAAVVAWQPLGSSRLQPRLGDFLVVAYVLMGAFVSANAQRVTTTTQMFLLCTMGTVLFRPRGVVQVLATLVGLAVALAGIAVFQREPFARQLNPATVIMFSALAVGAFLAIDRSRVRELQARSALARMNASLERRVEDQVGEIVARAREIEGLNVRLSEKVAERSRELSMALARLAGADRGQSALERGTVLGDRVTIEEPIGAGGMGIVYRGFDRVSQSPVAVKLVQAASAGELDGLHRFLREAQAMASVHHPAVVRSLHVDVSEDGRLFQIMELVEGDTLAARLRLGGAMPPPVAARVGQVLAAALASAHAAGVVHCDVKPANIMITRAPPGLKLLDFGVSQLRGAHRGREADGARVLGTPEFMAPEQAGDRESVTDRTDVYALGLVVYECLARRLPYSAQTPRDWMIAHATRLAADVRELVPGVADALADVVMACLQKDPLRRPSAAEAAEALGAFADRAAAPPLEQVPWPTLAAPPAATTLVDTVVAARRGRSPSG